MAQFRYDREIYYGVDISGLTPMIANGELQSVSIMETELPFFLIRPSCADIRPARERESRSGRRTSEIGRSLSFQDSKQGFVDQVNGGVHHFVLDLFMVFEALRQPGDRDVFLFVRALQ